VNYLDVAVRYVRHDWSAAINSYWSPLYSWLLASTMAIFRPTPRMESTVLHALNFLIFLGALACGEFFLRQLIRELREDSMPEWALWCIGYSLLLFVSLSLNPPSLDTPDLCTSGLFYLAAGLLIRMRAARTPSAVCATFGCILAFAYFSKTVMFLVAFAFFVAAGVRRQTLVAVACFLAIALPWIVILSHSVGHLTYGDAGTINYMKYVSSSGTPLHPVRLMSSEPKVWEFATSIQVTYPPWYVTSWVDGIHPHLELKKQAAVLISNAHDYLRLLSGQKVFMLVFLLVFLAWPSMSTNHWYLLIPPLSGFGLYALVHVEPRLVGAFFFISWMVLFTSLRVRLRWVVVLAAIAIIGGTVTKVVMAQLGSMKHSENVQWYTAEGLLRAGLPTGSYVAVFGHGDEGDYWAHLAGLRIVADIEREQMPAYWSLPNAARAEIEARLEQRGVQAIISTGKPREDGWQTIPRSTYYLRLLLPSDSPNVKDGR